MDELINTNRINSIIFKCVPLSGDIGRIEYMRMNESRRNAAKLDVHTHFVSHMSERNCKGRTTINEIYDRELVLPPCQTHFNIS